MSHCCEDALEQEAIEVLRTARTRGVGSLSVGAVRYIVTAAGTRSAVHVRRPGGKTRVIAIGNVLDMSESWLIQAIRTHEHKHS